MANYSAEGDNPRLLQGQVFAIALLLSLTIMISWRLLAGGIAPEQGFLWLGICCLCPIVWYVLGYLKTDNNLQSNALITSAIGWIFVSMAFFVHYTNVRNAGPGIPATQVSDPVLTILLLLGLFVIIAGGMLSWQAVTKLQSTDTTLTQ